jgi:hypothetical protein
MSPIAPSTIRRLDLVWGSRRRLRPDRQHTLDHPQMQPRPGQSQIRFSRVGQMVLDRFSGPNAFVKSPNQQQACVGGDAGILEATSQGASRGAEAADLVSRPSGTNRQEVLAVFTPAHTLATAGIKRFASKIKMAIQTEPRSCRRFPGTIYAFCLHVPNTICLRRPRGWGRLAFFMGLSLRRNRC